MPILRGTPSRKADRHDAARVTRTRAADRSAATGFDGKPRVGSPTPTDVSGPDAGFGDAAALAFVLDQMPLGVLLVDGAGRVVWMNRNAQARIRSRDGITLCDGRPAARSNGDSAALDQLVERAVASSKGRATRDPETIALPRGSRTRPLVVVVRPVDRPGGGRRANGAARAAIFLLDPDHDLRTSRERLQRLFRLTPAESQLASLLAAGCSLRAAASRLALTNESARTYLKHIFQKTGTRRQAEFVRLALAAATAGAGDR